MAFRNAVFAILSLSTVISSAFPSPFRDDVTYVVHEERNSASGRWIKGDRVQPSSLLPMRIGLVENTDNAEQYLLDVSDPTSPNYGRYWSMEQVIEHFQPSKETVDAVHGWLVDAGIAAERITHSDNKGWFAFHATGDEAERLLRTEFYEFKDTVTGGVRPACEMYQVPQLIQQHIDYITPGTLLFAPSNSDENQNIEGVRKGGLPIPLKHRPTEPISKLIHNLEDCDLAITPACVAALYDIPPTTSNPNPSNALGIYEAGQHYAQKDLNLFFRNFTPNIPQGTHPVRDSKRAPGPTKHLKHAGGEADLDLQLAYPIVYPQTIDISSHHGRVFQVGETILSYEWSFNSFFDMLDGSYCTPHGSNGKLKCPTHKLENVLSTSYGGQEADATYQNLKRQCTAFMKYGLQGVTFLFSSGDAGVGNYPAPYGGDNPKTGCLGPKGNIFNPTAPSTCPWVTSVGATKVYPGNTVFQPRPESAVFDPVGHPFHVNYSSGGGFSNVFPIPSYQQSAVKTFLTQHKPPYPSYKRLVKSTSDIRHLYAETGGIFNTIGRGIPDVAANGDNIAIYNKGEFMLSGGTSASAPIFSSIINRIVEERLKIGKGPLGFINPALYAHPYVLNDIVNGTNPGCFTDGFTAVPGWEPVNGLGTPNYPRMLALFLSLP